MKSQYKNIQQVLWKYGSVQITVKTNYVCTYLLISYLLTDSKEQSLS